MKFHLIAALFLAVLVAVPCFAEEETPKNDAPMANGQLLGAEDPNGPPIDGVPAPGDEQDEETDENDEAEEDETDLSSIPEELRDEVQEAMKRRVRHRLSARCCNILKYYRQCSNYIIRKLCPRQCRPICKNLLSWQSCNLVRRKYRRCRYHIGRFYCKQSCGYCRKPTPRPKRWVTRMNYWCGVNNRKLLKSYNSQRPGTLSQCRALCLRTRGCKAVERWGKYNFNCYHCINYKLMKPYTNSKDLAYPAMVSYLV